MLVLLDHGSRTNESGQSIFYNLFRELAHTIQYIELATYLEEALGNTKYDHQYSGIPKKGFLLVLLVHGSRSNERYPSIFNKFSREFAYELQYFEVGHLPRRGVWRHEIASPGQWYSKHRIHVGHLGSWLKYK
jgi:hypothetical protein